MKKRILYFTICIMLIIIIGIVICINIDNGDNKKKLYTKTPAGKVTETINETEAVTEKETNDVVSLETDSVLKPDIKDLMLAAVEPIGKCLYVYGGGWNEADDAAGQEALMIGISERWKSFFEQNDASYDYENYRYMIHDGLDCTGHLGWTMYQVFEDSYSEIGYVFMAKNTAENYSEIFRSPTVVASDISDYKCGDIMCSKDHVFIVIGQCKDGSLLFVNCSPPDLSLCGTCTPNGEKRSQAVELAQKYMKQFYTVNYERYNNTSRNDYYLTSFDQVRLTEEIITDKSGYRDKTPEEILADIYKW